MDRRTAVLLAGAAAMLPCISSRSSAQGAANMVNNEWVERVLAAMNRIKPGMTRTDLLDVFTTEGPVYRATSDLRESGLPLFQGRCHLCGCRTAK